MQFRIFSLPSVTQKVKIKIYKNIVLPVDLYGYETWFLTERKDTYRGYLRIGCCGECLDLRGIK
jgi:hypothetical protein